ncbi:ribonuclease H family protein [soil metagenome]
MEKKPKFYVVWKGRKPGVFTTWDDCKRSIEGFPDARYKSFESKSAADVAFKENPAKHIFKKTSDKPTVSKINNIAKGQPNTESICVDAACSGNPGRMEYQGVETKTKELLFHQGPHEDGTNNVGEFLALVHALAYLQQKQLPSKIIYSDSKIAIGWVKKKKCNTKLARTKRNAILFEYISRAEKWLETNKYFNPILKWETEYWGEIPADFGRK